MLKYSLIGLATVILLFLIVAATRPDEFRVTRTAVIPAPAASVFEQVNNLQNWNGWSPWAKLDPSAKNTFEGPLSGGGASFAWVGNSKAGEGKMRITESKPNERILMKLDFVKPMAATNLTEFRFHPENGGTAVTWTMTGRNNFVGKCVGLIMNCEKMVGDQFEEGLQNLHAVSVRAPQTSVTQL